MAVALGGRAELVRRRAARVVHLARPARGAEHASGVRARLLGRGRSGGGDDGDEGAVPRRERAVARDAEQPVFPAGAAASYPAPDGRLTFDKLSVGVPLGQQDARRSAEPHQVETRVPRELAELWSHMCPAQVYEVGPEQADGTVEVKLSPSNCVQCGAITAKGGRLTPQKAARARSTHSRDHTLTSVTVPGTGRVRPGRTSGRHASLGQPSDGRGATVRQQRETAEARQSRRAR